MELILISNSKLKIMLSAEDLKEFGLSADTLDYSNTETKRMFWDVLGRAKKAVGFDTDGHRVLVQLYPSRDGRCELFITRLGAVCQSECKEGAEEETISVITKGNMSKPQKKSSSLKSAVFSFDTMEYMLAVCRRLFALNYTGDSEAYLGDDCRCYLFLSDVEPPDYILLDEYSFITEYGTPENAVALAHFVAEHAKPICAENAVSALSKL